MITEHAGSWLATVGGVRCPSCGADDTKVIDSRTAEEGAAIRRRRSCPCCAYRFTTYERLEEVPQLPLVVVKRSGERQPFDRAKIVAGVVQAAKGRPVTVEQAEQLAADVEDLVRAEGAEVTSSRVGVAVLDHLRSLDEVSYVRFASVYKGFDDAADFAREVNALTKEREPSAS